MIVQLKTKVGKRFGSTPKNSCVFLTQSRYQPNKCPVRNRSYILKNINSRIDFSTKILIVPMFGLYPHKTHKFLSSLLFGESIPSCPDRRGGTEQNDIILPNSIIKSPLCHSVTLHLDICTLEMNCKIAMEISIETFFNFPTF